MPRVLAQFRACRPLTDFRFPPPKSPCPFGLRVVRNPPPNRTPRYEVHRSRALPGADAADGRHGRPLPDDRGRGPGRPRAGARGPAELPAGGRRGHSRPPRAAASKRAQLRLDLGVAQAEQGRSAAAARTFARGRRMARAPSFARSVRWPWPTSARASLRSGVAELPAEPGHECRCRRRQRPVQPVRGPVTLLEDAEAQSSPGYRIGGSPAYNHQILPAMYVVPSVALRFTDPRRFRSRCLTVAPAWRCAIAQTCSTFVPAQRSYSSAIAMAAPRPAPASLPGAASLSTRAWGSTSTPPDMT